MTSPEEDRTGEVLRIGDQELEPGQRARVQLPVARLITGEFLSLNVEVVRGSEPGPGVWLSGAIHGDELDGVEIVRRVLRRLDPATLAGTVYGVPVVNLFGFLSGSRYLPDRRDLNRAFPGRENGSMAARLAHLFTTRIVQRCAYGFDFHCGSDNRANLPQLRANLDDEATRDAARAFGAPVIIHGTPPDGSLRKAAAEEGARVLVYEAGEAHRFNAEAIRVGVRGVMRVLGHLGMIPDAPEATAAGGPGTGMGGSGPIDGRSMDAEAWIRGEDGPVESRKTRWIRAGRSGVCRLDVALGDRVSRGDRLGEISDTFGRNAHPLKIRHGGVVIGVRINPLVHKGEAVVHLAEPLEE